jgi:hypothetical protein
MRFSLKDMFRIATVACLYMAALGISIDAKASKASGVPDSDRLLRSWHSSDSAPPLGQ